MDLSPSFDGGWAGRLSQSPELGGRNSAVGNLVLRLTLLRSARADCVAARRPRRSPTVDETFEPPPTPLVSCHSCLRARPASDPSVVDHSLLQRCPRMCVYNSNRIGCQNRAVWRGPRKMQSLQPSARTCRQFYFGGS